jgi:hypothetical protein
MTDDTHETLWITDAELIRRIGVPEKSARSRLHFLDAKPQYQFPRKNPMWGNRRYWPAVKAYFDKNQGMVAPGAVERGTIKDAPPTRSKVHATA